MVTFGFMATSAVSQRARKISVIKKISDVRSRIVLNDVPSGSSGFSCLLESRAKDLTPLPATLPPLGLASFTDAYDNLRAAPNIDRSTSRQLS
jgi:hypothetical protein